MIAVQPAEWLRPQVVLLCAPRVETLAGVLAPDAANFRRPFSLAAARREHDAFRRLLGEHRIRTIDVREALASRAHVGPNELREWARAAVEYEIAADVTPDQRKRIGAQLDELLAASEPSDLVELLFVRPSLTISPNPRALDRTSSLDARLALRTISNAYYLRDPMMTTAAGVVVGRLRLDVRAPENDLAEKALASLGLAPLYRVTAPGTLEGGDFIPCGTFALQGTGLLTNRAGVEQCLSARAYGRVEVALVCDERYAMDEVLLDSYCAVLDRDLCALCEGRLGAAAPRVEVYVPEGTAEDFAYRLARTTTLPDYLAEKGMRIIPFSKAEGERFAANGFLLGPRMYACAAGVGLSFMQRLRDAGVTVFPLEFSALGGGYGGPHASTQALVRA
jgi:arginine deiminase